MQGVADAGWGAQRRWARGPVQSAQKPSPFQKRPAYLSGRCQLEALRAARAREHAARGRIGGPAPHVFERASLDKARAIGERSEPDRRAVQIVLIGALDLHGCDLADPQRPAARDIDRTIDLRRVALAAALGDGRANLVDDHLLAGANLALEAAH